VARPAEPGPDRQAHRGTLPGHELAQLVGDILRAEGFVTTVSPAGPDGGVDILAGQGSMGFDGATLAVQVKSGQADAPTLHELQGVMSNFGATRGLLVCWGRVHEVGEG
jgi:restriction system protein